MVNRFEYKSKPASAEEVSLLLDALCEIHDIANSEVYREISQKGYGDIEEIAEKAIAPFKVRVVI